MIEIPFAVERRIERDFAPLRQRIPQFHTGPLVRRFAVSNSPVLIKIELESIWQTNFDFVPEGMFILSVLKCRRPEIRVRNRARRPHVNAARAECSCGCPFRLLVWSHESL